MDKRKKIIILLSAIVGVVLVGVSSYLVYDKILKSNNIKESDKGNSEDNIEDNIPENAYKIEDLREEKTDLTGRYVYIDNYEIFFEIFDEYAVLHENFEDGNVTNENGSKVLEIEYIDGAIWLNFLINFKNSASVTSFYSEEDKFIWLDTIPFSQDKSYFIKQNN